MAKAAIQLKIDAQGWKSGEQNRLDTCVVQTVNYLHFLFGYKSYWFIMSDKQQTAVCVTPCKYSPKTESKKIRPS